MEQEKNKAIWIAIYVDIGKNCDSKGHVLGAFPSEEDAKKLIGSDMDETYRKFSLECDREVNLDVTKMYVYNNDYSSGREWSIEKVIV